MAKLTGKEDRLQSGIYRLTTGMSEDTVLYLLSQGKVATLTVTIPEGLRMEEIAQGLEKEGVVDADTFLELCEDKKLLSDYEIPFSTAEGFLFPDTYKLPVDVDAEEVIRMMVSRFFKVAEPLLVDAPLDTLIILASIVEREAYLAEERPIIASVFYNRLKKGLPLESCATVEYALPEHKESLTYADLGIPSAYNTYLHAGLPPGPICSPGKASLAAAANPAYTKYLYFVSKGDGSHHFSETAQEHERMKRKFSKERSRSGS